MATSGSKSVTVTKYDTLKFSWSETSQSIANNTTTISWKMELISGAYGEIVSSYSKKWSVTVNGEEYSGTNKVAIGNNATKTLASGSTTIAHNSDGTKSFSYSFSQQFSINFSGGSVGTKSGSGTGTLDTIARASSITAKAANIGSATTITINRASSDFTHTLTYAFGSLSGTIATKTTSTSVSWTVPTSFYAQIPNAKTGTCTITCETFNGSTSVGKKTATFTATAAESACRPTLNPSVIDTNSKTVALTGDNKILVKYYSTVSTDSNAAARNSATLKSQKTTNGSKSVTTETGTFSNVENNKFTFTATDSRGYSITAIKTVTMINYIKLTCTFAASMTVDGVLSFSTSGNYFNGSFGSSANTLTVQYRYRDHGGTYGAWTALTASKSGNKYTAEGSISGLDYRMQYDIQIRALDALATVTAAEKTITALPVFDWGADDFNFNVPVNMNIKENSYSLLGLLYAMTTTYELETDVTPGANYDSVTATAHLIGGNLRIGISAVRNGAVNVGNVTNETVATILIDHGGKMNNLYRVSFNSSTEGGAATFDAQAVKVDDNTVRVTINLCATTTAATGWNAYFAMPCSIVTKAYV